MLRDLCSFSCVGFLEATRCLQQATYEACPFQSRVASHQLSFEYASSRRCRSLAPVADNTPQQQIVSQFDIRFSLVIKELLDGSLERLVANVVNGVDEGRIESSCPLVLCSKIVNDGITHLVRPSQFHVKTTATTRTHLHRQRPVPSVVTHFEYNIQWLSSSRSQNEGSLLLSPRDSPSNVRKRHHP